MSKTKILLAVLFTATAAAAIYSMGWKHYRCNVERKFIETRLTEVLREGSSDWVRTETGRATADALHRCIATMPADYELWALLGKAETAADAPDRAIAAYQRALNLNERPEIHAALALLYFDKKDPERGYQHLLRASLFSTQYAWVTTPWLTDRLYKDFEARRRRIEANLAARKRD